MSASSDLRAYALTVGDHSKSALTLSGVIAGSYGKRASAWAARNPFAGGGYRTAAKVFAPGAYLSYHYLLKPAARAVKAVGNFALDPGQHLLNAGHAVADLPNRAYSVVSKW